eukprot:COSAG02_NODE_4340_length_5485_cov_2.496101_8_plen_176_part_00
MQAACTRVSTGAARARRPPARASDASGLERTVHIDTTIIVVYARTRTRTPDARARADELIMTLASSIERAISRASAVRRARRDVRRRRRRVVVARRRAARAIARDTLVRLASGRSAPVVASCAKTPMGSTGEDEKDWGTFPERCTMYIYPHVRDIQNTSSLLLGRFMHQRLSLSC